MDAVFLRYLPPFFLFEKKSDFLLNLICFFGFWSYSKTLSKNGAVAQLARAIRSHRIGHGFDSHQLHHFWSSKPLRTSKLQIRAVFSCLGDACSGALLLHSEVFGSIWRNCVDLIYSIVRMSIRGNNRNSFFARCRLKNQVPDFLWFLRDCRKPVFFYKSLFSLLILFCDML